MNWLTTFLASLTGARLYAAIAGVLVLIGVAFGALTHCSAPTQNQGEVLPPGSVVTAPTPAPTPYHTPASPPAATATVTGHSRVTVTYPMYPRDAGYCGTVAKESPASVVKDNSGSVAKDSGVVAKDNSSPVAKESPAMVTITVETDNGATAVAPIVTPAPLAPVQPLIVTVPQGPGSFGIVGGLVPGYVALDYQVARTKVYGYTVGADVIVNHKAAGVAVTTNLPGIHERLFVGAAVTQPYSAGLTPTPTLGAVAGWRF